MLLPNEPKLNIVRAKFEVDGNRNKFFITCAKTGEKIFSSDRLEEIRMTIINNLILLILTFPIHLLAQQHN